MFCFSSWYRFFTAQTDYQALLKTMSMKVKKITDTFIKNSAEFSEMKKLCKEGKLNELFFNAFRAYEKKEKPCLFILAGNDSGTEIFRHYFQSNYLMKKNQNIRKGLHEVFIIENANHIYTLFECQISLQKKICEWLACHFNVASDQKSYH